MMSALHHYPLHLAAREGRYGDLCTLLDSRRFDVNKGTFELVRPLHEACLAGHLDCVSLLLDHDAQVNLRNIDGATALCDACCHGDLACVKLLLDKGALVNPPFLLTTPLHEAVLRDNWKCVSMLIDHGAYLDVSDCHFGTPLHIAAYKGFIRSAAVLLHSGANPNVCKTHQSPLHEAARTQDVEFLQLLLEYGADVYACNNGGLTAYQLVPSSASPCKRLLQHWESTPRSLKDTCRLTIRRALKPGRLHLMAQLRLPKIVVRYLRFE